HRLAVVGRADDEQVGHPLLAGPVEQGFKPVQCFDCSRIANPTVSSDALNTLIGGESSQALGCGEKMWQVSHRLLLHGYQSSIWSNGRAGGSESLGGSGGAIFGGADRLGVGSLSRCLRRCASRRLLRVVRCAVSTIACMCAIMRNS